MHPQALQVLPATLLFHRILDGSWEWPPKGALASRVVFSSLFYAFTI